MFPARYIICIFLVLLTISLGYAASGNYAYAKVESCRGCTLQSIPDVKSFIFNDLPLYSFRSSLRNTWIRCSKGNWSALSSLRSCENAEFIPIQGAKPELIFYDKNEEEIERLALSQLTREECNELMISKGFTKKLLRDEV